ncbi:tRNA pseudouridine(38-40) synthase TruA [bacterium]|nr:tRNA pseudouridine(38-40) synthase TruA [bacterium]
MRNLKLTFEYDGTHFWGYQRQRAGRTVQGELEAVLSTITNSPVTLFSAGRTDSGVHSAGQVANFKTETCLAEPVLLKGINSLLPRDIALQSIEEVSDDFHARFSALSRCYEYRIYNSLRKTVFNRLYALHIPQSLEREAMSEACEYLIGERDFSSFRAIGDVSTHSFRRMIKAGGRSQGEVFVLFFEANAFLQHMIRIIVGTLLAVGRGNMTIAEFREIVLACDRSKAGPTAPPHPLCLTNVRYFE